MAGCHQGDLAQRFVAARGLNVAFTGRSSVCATLRVLDDSTLDNVELELLRALRGLPDSSLSDLAGAIGLPRTNFGRPLSRPVQRPLGELVADGLVEEHRGRYRLSSDGRRTLAEHALDGNL